MSLYIKDVRSNMPKHRLGQRIEAAITTIRKKKKYVNPIRRVEIKELSEAITGITKAPYKVFVNPQVWSNAFVYPPTYSKDSPLWQQVFRDWIPEALEEKGQEEVHRSSRGLIEYMVDPDTLEHKGLKKSDPIEIDIAANVLHHDLAWPLTPAQLTAVILHEIGHAIFMLTSIGWSVRTNYVLHLAHNRMMNTHDQSRRVKVLKEIADTEGLNIVDDIDEIAKLNDQKLLSTVILGSLISQQRDEYGADCYSARGYESLADHFATSMGYDLELVEALDSFPGSSRFKVTHGENTARKAMEILFQLIFGVLTGGFSTLILILSVILYDPKSKIYDDPKERFTRVLNSQLDALKQSRGKETDEMIKRIEATKKIIDEYGDARSLVERINEALLPSGKRTKSLRNLHQTLEELTSNHLHLYAAKLEKLANA